MSEPKNAPVVQGGNFKELYKKKFGTVLAKNRAMTPEQLFDLSVKYFEWAEDNAIKASESASFQGGVYESLVHKPRVFTWTGYRLFIGASEAAIIKWKPANKPAQKITTPAIINKKIVMLNLLD